MKFRHDIIKSGLLFTFIFLAALGAYAQPSWVGGYPQLLSGATSVDINVKTDSTSIIYYAIYKTAQSGITSVLLKNDALLGSSNPNLVRRGSVAITSNTLQTIKQTALTQNTTYHIYVVAESNGVLMANNKISYTPRFFPKRQQELFNFSNSFMNSSLMYFPEDYYKTNTTFPLLIFLGGTGEMSRGGTPNPDLLLLTGLPEVINQGKEVPMVVASPQGIWTWVGSHVALDAYIEFLKVTYRVNPSQIFLTGLSDGGRGVFEYPNNYPSKIKGIVPTSTWPDNADFHNFINIGVWGFMGNGDTYGAMLAFITSLKAIGGNAIYTGYPGGHEKSVWDAAYSGSRGDDIYAWMLNLAGLNQPPSDIPPVVNAGADQTFNLPLPSAQLTGSASDIDGSIASYLWTEVSGPPVTMTNANSATVTLTNITPGTYTFQLAVQDNVGGTAADQVTIFVTAGGAVSREFDVNITWTWNKQGGTIWNDFVTTSGGVVGNSLVLFDNNHISSPVSISITAPFVDGTNNHGVTPGIYPNNVMQYFLRSTTTQAGALKLSGLNLSSVYDLSILSSNTDVWYPSDTRLTVNGQPIIINAKSNSNQLANFLSVAPNASGEIVIGVAPSTTNSANIGVINALVLKERPIITNTPPVVNAGPDQEIVLPYGPLQLTGTATDADGTIASFLWTKVSGPNVILTNATTSTLTVTYIAAGTYVFQLQAQDNGGAASTDQVTVTVDPGTIIPPVANAGADQQVTLPLPQLQLAGIATDSDGFIYSWLWTKISGPAVTLNNAATSILTLTNLAAGTYVFQLSVQDNAGATAADQVTVTIIGNVAPVVNAGPDQQVTLPLSQLLLTGTATDSDGTIASLLWTEVSGPAVTMANTTTSTLTLTSLLAGTYVFQLMAQDNGGAVTTDQITVIVNPAPITGIREFDINLTWATNIQGSLPWNDFVTTNGAGSSPALFDKNGVTSPIRISTTAPFQVDGSNNHGVVPGLYPKNVMMFYLRSTQAIIGSLKLAGLNTAKQYDLSIMSSNADTWYPSDTRLTVQGQSATINAKSNANLLVNFVNVSPTAIGEIPITVAPATTSSTNVGVINAIILVEHDAGTIPGGRTTQTATITGNERPSASPDYVHVFPNPVEDHLNLEISSSLPTLESLSIEFIDIRGVQVYIRQVESQAGTNYVSESISADFMQSGLYIMAVRSRQNGVRYFKILKK